MMMVDKITHVGNGQGKGGGKAIIEDEESHRLLASSSSGASSLYERDTLLNDLSYSDDDETDEYWASAELGVSGSMSSPDTAKLLDDIQNAMFPTQEPSTMRQHQQYQHQHQHQQQQHQHHQQQQHQHQHQQQQSHLMHPLARQESETDEGSYLAYSITSSQDGLRNSSETLRSSTETLRGSSEDVDAKLATALASAAKHDAYYYGSLDAYFTPNTTSAAVTFRLPSSVFDHSPRTDDGANRPHHRERSSRRKKSPSETTASSKRQSHSHPPQSSAHASNDGGNGRRPSLNNGGGQEGPTLLPVTPFPSMISESPVTSATATDDAHSPANDCDDDGNNHARPDRDGADGDDGTPEKERIAALLAAEKRVRRHRRLKRIKKAAEAREAAVREVRGTEQPHSGCNDAVFAFAFLCQFLLVSVSALAFGPGALGERIYAAAGGDAGGGRGDEAMVADYNPFAGLQTDDVIIANGPLELMGGRGASETGGTSEGDLGDGISHIDYVNVLQLVCIVSGYASLCSLLALGFMMMLSKSLLHATLIFSIGVSLAWTVLGWAFSPGYILPITGVVALALSSSYTFVVWDRIPFATTNLGVALKGMRSTLDIPIVGLCVLMITFLWTIWWICAFVGTFNFLHDDEELSNDWMSVVVVFFFFSYYWTFQVIKGISQTMVASIIGKWWDMSEEDALPLCSSVLYGSASRTIVRSFGSICLGSLIVGPCIVLTRISIFFRLAKPKLNKLTNSPKRLSGVELENEKCDPGCLPILTSCAPQNDGIISRNVNQWSYTYIGLYGYTFWESGSRASQLFEARGWTHVVSDDLIMTAMFMSSMIIGCTTACLGLIVEEMDGFSFTSLNKPISTAFLICLFLGFFLSCAFLSIIEGSVSAILVCYAAAPVDFHANHHKLSEEMKSAWKHFWLQKPIVNNNGR